MMYKNLKIILLTVLALLLIPLVAMQFTNEVNWSLFDFIIAAVLLFGTGFVIDLVIGKTKNIKYRVAILILMVIAFILIWAELAVGVFGTPFSGS
ncbi:MAG: hypothetical protein GY908_11320 [Flavobacteriales bacterium]|mgnify:FL=1|nr:hypothetical protein [Flavobacteriales bacterium]